MRRYFILNRPSLDEFTALEMCIGAMHTQRYSLDGSKIFIKTTQSDIDNYINGDVSILGTEYSIEGDILTTSEVDNSYGEYIIIQYPNPLPNLYTELGSSEWTSNDIL